MESGILVPIVKTAFITVVMSKVSKSVGEKEISEIIVCVGVLVCGMYIMKGIMPLLNGLQEFGRNINEGATKLKEIGEALTFWKK